MYDSDNKNNSAGTGIRFSGLLTIAFIVLKLCKVIDWKWIWVLAPLWISTSLTLIILLIVVVIVLVKDKS